MSAVSLPAYAQQRSQLTLREALAEYYRSNPGLLDPDGMPDTVAQLFRQHDVGHVIFGCDTSLAGEVRTDMWTIFGASIGLRGYIEYLKYPQVNDVLEGVGYWQITVASLRSLPDVGRIFLRSRKMTRPWPWEDYEPLLDQTLCELRDEYGVRVLE
jgi:hypothetical protein